MADRRNAGLVLQEAFTLIELLTVIAVIAVLAGVIFPVLASARRSAWSASCISNLKQIWTAHSLYIQGWDGCMPYTWAMYDVPSRGLELTPENVLLWEGWVRDAEQNLVHTFKPWGASPLVHRCPADIGAQFDFDYRLKVLRMEPLWERFGTSYLYIMDGVGYEPLHDAYWLAEKSGAFPVAFDHVGFWHGRPSRDVMDYYPDFTDPRTKWWHNTVMSDGSARPIQFWVLDEMVTRTLNTR